MSKEKYFVITPIGKENDKIRRHIDGIIDAVIKPTLDTEYDIVVAHQMYEIGSITKQIIKELYNSKLVIANLTEVNPNVMYELAFRHTIGKPVIVIAEEGTKLPFDISDERTIFYNNDAKGTLELKAKLKEYVGKIDFNEKSSPILDVISDLKVEDLLLKKASDNNEESGSFKYILDRLDSIESSIKSVNTKKQFKYPKNSTTKFSYTTDNKEIDEIAIYDEIYEASEIDENLTIEAVTFGPKEIIISERLFDKVNVPKILNYYITTLEKHGLKDIEIEI